MTDYACFKRVVVKDRDHRRFKGWLGVPAMHPWWGLKFAEIDGRTNEEIAESVGPSQRPLKDISKQYWWFRIVSPRGLEESDWVPFELLSVLEDKLDNLRDEAVCVYLQNPKPIETVISTVFSGTVHRRNSGRKFEDIKTVRGKKRWED